MTEQPELRLSPDGQKIAARWTRAPKPTWYIFDLFDIHEAVAIPATNDDIEAWQRLVVDPDGENKDYLRRQWVVASAKANAAESELAREQRLLGFAQDRIRGLEADIATRWQTANIDESVKTELRHRTAELDAFKSSLHDALDNWKQVQLIGVTRLGMKLGFYPHDLDAALEHQAREIERLKAELEQLRREAGDPE